MPYRIVGSNIQKDSRIVSIDIEVPNSRFTPVLEWLVRNKGSLNRDHAANMMGMTAGGFSRAFLSEFGWSFRETQREIKLQIAACLLSHTQLPIADVAEQVGYFEIRQFQKAFKRRYAISPARYRGIEQRKNLRRKVDIGIVLGEMNARCKILLASVLKPKSKSA
jgi:transcriptional regulator GlxA family with amidase domain